MLAMWPDPSSLFASTLPFFEVTICLSALVSIVIIVRLYRGIRILNARMDILSTLVRNLRKELELTSGIDQVVYTEFDAVDAKLQNQLKGDFAMKGSHSQELLTRFSGRDLVRSSIDLAAVAEPDNKPAAEPVAAPLNDDKSKKPPTKGKDLESYEAKESGLQVDVKSDLSYIGTPQDGSKSEPIPDLPKAED